MVFVVGRSKGAISGSVKSKMAAIVENSIGHISVTGDTIHLMFGSTVGSLGLADQVARIPVRSNPRRWPLVWS